MEIQRKNYVLCHVMCSTIIIIMIAKTRTTRVGCRCMMDMNIYVGNNMKGKKKSISGWKLYVHCPRIFYVSTFVYRFFQRAFRKRMMSYCGRISVRQSAANNWNAFTSFMSFTQCDRILFYIGTVFYYLKLKMQANYGLLLFCPYANFKNVNLSAPVYKFHES